MHRRVLLVVAVVGLVLTACQPVPYSAGPGPRVFRTGDSVLWDANDEVRTSMQAAGFRTAAAVYPGTSIQWSADRIMEQVWGDEGRGAPDVVLVASGHMNAIGGWTAEDEGEVRRVLDWANPEARCTIWVLPSAVRYPAGRPGPVIDADTRAVADGIRRIASTRGVRFVDWERVAAEHPEWSMPDGVHHDAAGQAAYAELVVREVRRLCGI